MWIVDNCPCGVWVLFIFVGGDRFFQVPDFDANSYFYFFKSLIVFLFQKKTNNFISQLVSQSSSRVQSSAAQRGWKSLTARFWLSTQSRRHFGRPKLSCINPYHSVLLSNYCDITSISWTLLRGHRLSIFADSILSSLNSTETLIGCQWEAERDIERQEDTHTETRYVSLSFITQGNFEFWDRLKSPIHFFIIQSRVTSSKLGPPVP